MLGFMSLGRFHGMGVGVGVRVGVEGQGFFGSEVRRWVGVVWLCFF